MLTPLRVLILADKPSDAELLLSELRRAGFEPDWLQVETKEEYLHALHTPFDLILSDYSLPQFDGLSAVRLLRARGLDLPFILVSGTVGEEIAVTAMKEGADDYLLKDRLTRFGPAVRSALERKNLRDEGNQAEETLRLAEARYRILFEKSPNGILLIDSQSGKTIEANEAAPQQLGYTREEFAELRVSDYEVEETPEDTARHMQKILHLGTDDFETRHRTKSGGIRDIHVFAKTVQIRERNYFYAVFQDITDRISAEKALLKLNADLEERVRERTAEAEAANQAKSMFLANMSHEIRTPMNAVLGFAQLLHRDQSLSVVQKQYIETILRSGEHLLALISDILDYSKIEAGRFPLMEANFDFAVMLRDLKEVFRLPVETKGLVSLIEWDPPGPCFLVGDEGKLRQILQNLLSNAVKFTDYGTVSLRAVVKPVPEPGTGLALVVEVEDTGWGIAPEEMDKLFKVFEQTESGRRSTSGTGLGLAISYRFAELLGGKLEAQSQQGRGSLFRLEIPVKKGQKIEPDPAPALPCLRLELETDQPAFRILVADDQADTRELFRALLAGAGFEVRTAQNGAQALVEFETWKPQLILMDLNMPVVTGLDAIRRIRALEEGDRVKIIAVTAHAFQQDRQLVLDAGADDYLTKPVREDGLFEKIRTHLGVLYCCASEESEPVEEARPTIQFLRAEVEALPGVQVAELRSATLCADLQRLLELAGQVEMHSPGLGQEVRRLATHFAYRELLVLLENHQSEKESDDGI